MEPRTFRQFVRQWIFPLTLALLSLLFALLGDTATGLLQYSRTMLESGQIWRAVSGHLVHLGWGHLTMNLAGLLLVWLLAGSTFSQRLWWAIFLLLCLATSLGLYLFNSQLHYYVGLSGVLHGLLLVAVVPLALHRDGEGLFLLLAVMGKLVWEQFAGAMPGSAEMAGGRVIVDAHWYGGLGGIVLGLLLRGRARLRSRGD